MRNTLITLLCGTAVVVGCKTTDSQKTQPEPVIIQFGEQQVPTSEFRYVYEKNNANSPDIYTEESLRDYLTLYTNFKLKVYDAERMGLDTTEAFETELDGYKQQLAQPYLTEKSVTEQLVSEAYERLKQEVNASHILIEVAPEADPRDTLAAYNKAVSIRQQALGGRDFATLARHYSQDPSVTRNDGNLGYFTALQMVYPFEDAAFRTPVGGVSEPVRTRFGYHIIKVHDRRPSRGRVKVAHLMVRANTGMSEADSLQAKRKIDELAKRLADGEPWDALVAQFSEDNSSRNRGGVLPIFGTGNMIPSFEEAAFALKNPGDLSEPTQTPYGWHIIKLIEKEGLAPFSELENDLRAKVNKDSRSELNRSALIKRLKSENEFAEKASNVDAALAGVDSTFLTGTWKYDPNATHLTDVLFTVKDSTLTRRDFYNYLSEHQRKSANTSPEYAARLAYDQYVDETLVAYERDHLAEKYVDYRMLVKEYRDGILLFQLMDEKVWSQAIEDTAGLRSFFEQHRDDYRWDERAQAVIYNTANQDVLREVKQKLDGKIFPIQEKFSDITFEAGQSELTEPQKDQLAELLGRAQRDSTLYIDVIGHVDASEKSSVSKARALAVRNYFAEQGIEEKRLIAKDFGRRPPVGAAKLPHNRRVSFLAYSSSNEELERLLNVEQSLNLDVIEGKFQKGDQPVLDQIEWKPGTYEVARDGRIYLVKIKTIEAPRGKTLSEARGQAISDYQNYLEQQWVEQLRATYPVTVNEEEVQKLIRPKSTSQGE
ncbi:peptidyl-prolyl cis-trans isomerase SurA [Catalinimonas alkaloidigena]|uniref:Peptidyl-prolyl cis-trans isomerase SurA n=1 Tax=Catalinimonas alkaloidigena TaxID=1075417 RepID=A0A1G9NG08_9BACT|nr:peptidylprolyl isomerase [Catalinimonas alkaloidigena]SDL84987.1 peptidyl-prolyl cis-trans isomerase SurA [Catalinimonas alkaloidigena]